LTRTQLRELAEIRALDAEALLNAKQWSGVYYLAGYAVECGLKACIAKLTNQDDFPDKKLAQDCFTHNVEDLVRLAGLTYQLKASGTANPTFAAYWLVAKDWNEQARYQQWTEPQARELFAAVTDPTNGVLSWIKNRW